MRTCLSVFTFEVESDRTAPAVFEYLEEHPEFKAEFLKVREQDSTLIGNHRAQLAWIYNNSEWLEKTWKRYPVGRIFN